MQSVHWPFLKRTFLITVWVRVIYPGHFLLWECAPLRRKTWFEKFLTIIMIVMVWYPNPTGFSVSPWRHHDSTAIKSSIHCSHLFTTPGYRATHAPPPPPVCQVVPLPCMMSLQHVSPGWFACCWPSLFLFLLLASPLVTWALRFFFSPLLELRFWHFDKRRVFFVVTFLVSGSRGFYFCFGLLREEKLLDLAFCQNKTEHFCCLDLLIKFWH